MKAIEILRCKECGEEKPYYGLTTSFSCGACRSFDCCESIWMCGKCLQVEIKDENDLCSECINSLQEHLYDLVTNR